MNIHQDRQTDNLEVVAPGAPPSLAKYDFVVLDRVRDRVGEVGLTSHLSVHDEKQITALQGYELSDSTGTESGVLLRTPPIGFVVDDDFVDRHPGAIARLKQIAPAIAGTKGVFVLSADGGGLLDWMLSRAFGISDDFIKSSINVQMEIARLQYMIRDQLEALDNAQRLVNQSTPPQPKLCVLLSPSNATICPKDRPDITSLSQNSKREFRVVHAFELHVAEGDKSRIPMTVTLTTAYSQEVIGTWTFPASALDKGWNRFDVPFRSKSLDEAVLIEIRWQNDQAPGTVFSLGEITADPRLGCLLSNGTVDERSLALRVYEGALGLQLPYHGWGMLADDDEPDKNLSAEQVKRLRDRKDLQKADPASDEISSDDVGGDHVEGSGGVQDERPDGPRDEKTNPEVMISELLKIAVPFNDQQQHNKDLLRYIDERLGLLVHPINNSSHIAIIRNVKVSHARAIVADVLLAHDAAPRTEFGLFAAPAGSLLYIKSSPEPRRPNIFRLMSKPGKKSSDEMVVAQAEWLALEGHQRGQIVFDLLNVDADSIDIFLVTRPGGAGINYAWAHFLNLTIVRKEAEA